MRNSRTLILAFAAGAFFAAPIRATAQQSDPVSGLLAQLASPQVTIRFAGFYALLSVSPAQNAVNPAQTANSVTAGVFGLLRTFPGDKPQIVAALNQLLIVENTDPSLSTLASDPDDESPGDFYGDVIEAVAALKDSSSIPALTGAIDTGGMATGTLASFGPAALPSVLPAVYSSDITKRAAAAFTLVEMLSPTYLGLVSDAVSQSFIRAGLQRAVGSFASSSTYQFMAAPYQAALAGMAAVPAGDLNGDGAVNCADLAIIKASFGKAVTEAGFDIRADVNGDGVVNVLDLSIEAKMLPAGTMCR